MTTDDLFHVVDDLEADVLGEGLEFDEGRTVEEGLEDRVRDGLDRLFAVRRCRGWSLMVSSVVSRMTSPTVRTTGLTTMWGSGSERRLSDSVDRVVEVELGAAAGIVRWCPRR